MIRFLVRCLLSTFSLWLDCGLSAWVYKLWALAFHCRTFPHTVGVKKKKKNFFKVVHFMPSSRGHITDFSPKASGKQHFKWTPPMHLNGFWTAQTCLNCAWPLLPNSPTEFHQSWGYGYFGRRDFAPCLFSYSLLSLCISISVFFRPDHIMTGQLYITGSCPCILSMSPPSSLAFINFSYWGDHFPNRAEASGRIASWGGLLSYE